MTTQLDNSNISVHLGQTSKYKSQYDSTLLVREPRSSNRTHLDIKDDDLPFVGYDTWNAYEVSGLTSNGLPVAGVAKIVYPCYSEFIVESKSIKLYFNSFNMFKCGETPEDVLQFITRRANEDLSMLLHTNVDVYIESADTNNHPVDVFDSRKYKTLEKMFTSEYLKAMEITQYVESPELLEHAPMTDDVTTHEEHFHSALLKSNCRVTSQPDWGDVYIYIKSHLPVDPESLLRYVISFRDECHFHEEICETIYKRMLDVYSPQDLCVTCLYARRGGIDINPTRASSDDLISKVLIDPTVSHVKTPKQ